MPQLRFNIGVPRAGSAAREAESGREGVRSLRPEAGSAARQAEQERRDAERWYQEDAPKRVGPTTIRMQTPRRRAAEENTSLTENPRREAREGVRVPSGQPVAPLLATPVQEMPNTVASPAGLPAGAVPTPTSTHLAPLQTAAAKFRSLFRSVFPRAAGEN